MNSIWLEGFSRLGQRGYEPGRLLEVELNVGSICVSGGVRRIL